MTFNELQSKDVVNVSDGMKLGRISDFEIDADTGKIINIFVQPNLKLSNLFSQNSSISLKWNQLIKIGEEVVIVNIAN